MRIAVLADAHETFHALDAALADLRGPAPDLIVDIGDRVSGPSPPAASADARGAERAGRPEVAPSLHGDRTTGAGA